MRCSATGKPGPLETICMLLILLAFTTSAAPAKVTADTVLEEGLSKTTFRTAEGLVIVYLPAEMIMGDTISGSIEMKGLGDSEAAIKTNKQTLENEYTVEIRRAQVLPGELKTEEDRKRPPAPKAAARAPVFSGVIPEKTKTIEISLLQGTRKKKYARVKMVEAPTESAPPSDSCYLPEVAQLEHPAVIRASFDGIATTTSVSVDGQKCDIMAESPRMTAFRSPATAIGDAKLTVSEKGKTASGVFANLAISIKANTRKLRQGERTRMRVTINGVKDTRSPFELVLKNTTPEIVQVMGGDQQVVRVPAGGRN